MCGTIIELLQFAIIHSFWASLCEALFQNACHQDAIKQTNTHNCIGIEKIQGDTTGGSKLIEQTLLSWPCNTQFSHLLFINSISSCPYRQGS